MLRGEYALLKSNLEKKSMTAEQKKNSLIMQAAKKKNDSGSSSDSEGEEVADLPQMAMG